MLPVCFTEKYGITPERPHSSSPVEGIVIEAARQLPLYFSRFFVVSVSFHLSHFLVTVEKQKLIITTNTVNAWAREKYATDA